MRLFDAVDRWWSHAAPARRADRRPLYLCALVGLLMPSLAIFWFGPGPSSVVAQLSEVTQVMLCGCIALGCVVALVAAAAPRRHVKYAYRMGYSAVPAILAGLTVYGWVILTAVEHPATAMSGMLTPMLALGFGLKGVEFWLESRRIERAERLILNGDNGSGSPL